MCIFENYLSFFSCAQIYLVIYCTPVGIASLIAQTILKACNITSLLKSLGLYVGTILIGFGIHALVALPITIFVLTRLNPYRIMRCAGRQLSLRSTRISYGASNFWHNPIPSLRG